MACPQNFQKGVYNFTRKISGKTQKIEEIFHRGGFWHSCWIRPCINLYSMERMWCGTLYSFHKRTHLIWIADGTLFFAAIIWGIVFIYKWVLETKEISRCNRFFLCIILADLKISIIYNLLRNEIGVVKDFICTGRFFHMNQKREENLNFKSDWIAFKFSSATNFHNHSSLVTSRLA